MSRHANIVSFEDVKAASRQRYASQGLDRSQFTSRNRDKANHYDLSRFVDEPGGGDDAEDATAQQSKNRLRSESRANATDNRELRRRNRAKARAEKLFDKQYADNRQNVGQEDGSPRAALYEGHMGSTQRKAARMQAASGASPVTAKINPAGWFSNISLSPGRLRAVTVIVCLVLAVVFLYTPAQHYYQAIREHERLAAEYESIAERNQTLSSQNVSLASNAGMEDAVRQKYGYVIEGDETAVVSGLSSDTTNDHSDGVEANVLSSSVKAPEEWYTPYLDALFGVS